MDPRSILLQPSDSIESLNEIGRLRYLAYRSVDAIPENEAKIFLDQYDTQGNSRSCLIELSGRRTGAIRSSVYAPEFGFTSIPCLEVYRGDLINHIGSLDVPIVESNRFVIHPNETESRYFFKAQFRFIILNILKYNADYVVTAVRKHHIPFYRRIHMFPISEPKKYPGIDAEMALLLGDCKKDLEKVIRQDSLYEITQDEIDEYRVCAIANV